MTDNVVIQSRTPNTRTALLSFASFLPIKKNANPKNAKNMDTEITPLMIDESNFDIINMYDVTAEIIGIISVIIAIVFLFIIKSPFRLMP